MKIGILTLPLHTNYGGILQAYALKNKLQEGSNHVDLLIHNCHFESRSVFKRCLNFLRSTHLYLFCRSCFVKSPSVNFQRFIFRNFSREEYSDTRSLVDKGYNAVVVGSDQVWRYDYTKNEITRYFLDDIKGNIIKKFSYAASFGTDVMDYPIEIRQRCAISLSSFNGVSVREESALKICRDKLNYGSALQVLDPTMLLSEADYLRLLNVKPIISKFSTFILDSTREKDNIIEYVSLGINAKALPVNSKNKKGVFPSIEKWIGRFSGSEYIVTDSFHGTAFSINFHKQFVVLSNEGRGQTRLLSILKTFGLEERLIFNKKDALRIIQKPIDWNSVDERMKHMRQVSESFLDKIRLS